MCGGDDPGVRWQSSDLKGCVNTAETFSAFPLRPTEQLLEMFCFLNEASHLSVAPLSQAADPAQGSFIRWWDFYKTPIQHPVDNCGGFCPNCGHARRIIWILVD